MQKMGDALKTDCELGDSNWRRSSQRWSESLNEGLCEGELS